MQDYKNPEVLQKVYAECGSLVKTAAYFGVSKKLILTHLKRFGITRNPPRSKKPIDAEQARALLESGVPVGQVAKEAGVSVSGGVAKSLCGVRFTGENRRVLWSQ